MCYNSLGLQKFFRSFQRILRFHEAGHALTYFGRCGRFINCIWKINRSELEPPTTKFTRSGQDSKGLPKITKSQFPEFSEFHLPITHGKHWILHSDLETEVETTQMLRSCGLYWAALLLHAVMKHDAIAVMAMHPNCTRGAWTWHVFLRKIYCHSFIGCAWWVSKLPPFCAPTAQHRTNGVWPSKSEYCQTLSKPLWYTRNLVKVEQIQFTSSWSWHTKKNIQKTILLLHIYAALDF
jgi:hypothetical protein